MSLLSDPLLRATYEGKFFGKFYGVVMDNNDPKKKYRVKLRVDAIFASLPDQPTVITDWALPSLPIGMFFLPDIGDTVWVEFRQGDCNYPIWSNAFIDEDTEGLPTEGYPHNQVMRTPLNRYKMEFNETPGHGYFKISDGFNTFQMNQNGIEIADVHANTISLNSSGIQITDKNSNSVTLSASGIIINSAANNTLIDGSAYQLHTHATTATTIAKDLATGLPIVITVVTPPPTDGGSS